MIARGRDVGRRARGLARTSPVALLVLVAACAGGPERHWRSAFSVHAAPGFEQHAAQIGEHARMWSPLVAERLGTNRATPLRVWVQPEPFPNARGFASERSIAVDPREQAAFTLAHELAHWHMHGSEWERLPQIVEEGVCDLIAAQGLGIDAELAALWLPMVPADPDERRAALRLPNRVYLRLPPEQQQVMRAYGWCLARQQGIDGLRELLERNADHGALLAALEATPVPADASGFAALAGKDRALSLPRRGLDEAFMLTVVWHDADGKPLSMVLRDVQTHAGPLPLVARPEDGGMTIAIPDAAAALSVGVAPVGRRTEPARGAQQR